ATQRFVVEVVAAGRLQGGVQPAPGLAQPFVDGEAQTAGRGGDARQAVELVRRRRSGRLRDPLLLRLLRSPQDERQTERRREWVLVAHHGAGPRLVLTDTVEHDDVTTDPRPQAA